MNWPKKLHASWRSALTGAALGVAVGLAIWYFWWGQRLVLLSYDLLFWFPMGPPPAEVIIVYMDDRSFNELGQTSTPNWDRDLHAQLLGRLTEDQCKLVVFDVVFSEPGTARANTNLLHAIQRHGKVVLAAALKYPSRPQIRQIRVHEPVLPLPEFQEAAVGWGVAEIDVSQSPDRIARQYPIGTEHQPSLPWTAAVVAGADVTKVPKPPCPKPG
jgi:CHASE2 domain-containing sensor protein